ncbi:MAG: hypothetical protein B6D64_12945 [Bacteroidetes bacterium 4484_276]|nr:MAG: hypothetical protein B6D64_12945 [Bacteroidetes bacterium 4484_276]OYT13317.1 MAG: hypothetical protein B6I19_05735 [Bacteroidetes bacterium 4572_114]
MEGWSGRELVVVDIIGQMPDCLPAFPSASAKRRTGREGRLPRPSLLFGLGWWHPPPSTKGSPYEAKQVRMDGKGS